MQMHAVIRNGGKQYKVSLGQTIKLEKMPLEAGGVVTFGEVLLVSDGQASQIGQPLVAHAQVLGEVVGHGRAKKIRIIKLKRRKHHLKHQGHRQHFTSVKITGIEAKGFKKSTQNEE
jgi:large subunit ribosomal protein L21